MPSDDGFLLTETKRRELRALAAEACHRAEWIDLEWGIARGEKSHADADLLRRLAAVVAALAEAV